MAGRRRGVRLSPWIRLARPFTLLAPAAGMVCWGLVAVGASPRTPLEPWIAGRLALGALAAAFLNVASNAVNQVFDVEIDRINKPHRPLPAGEIGTKGAGRFAVVFYALSLATAAAINLATLVLVLVTVLVTYTYSGPPFRTKRSGILANVTIAVPRGVLLPVAGWCAVAGGAEVAGKGPLSGEIWYLAAMTGLFVAGAATTKDYADMAGDRAAGCVTLPIRYGVRGSARIVAPFLTIPFLMLPIGVAAGTLSGPPVALAGLGVALAGWGAYVAWLLLREPEALTRSSTHPSWQHMYLLMVGTQAGLAVAYLAGAG
jgi:4-hydroxybenzoate polyprenyltransferase